MTNRKRDRRPRPQGKQNETRRLFVLAKRLYKAEAANVPPETPPSVVFAWDNKTGGLFLFAPDPKIADSLAKRVGVPFPVQIIEPRKDTGQTENDPAPQ